MVQRRCTDTLPLALILAYAVCSLEWTLYGMLEHDSYIVVPNAAGFLLGVTQLALFLVYPREEGGRSLLEWVLCIRTEGSDGKESGESVFPGGWEKDGDEDVLIESAGKKLRMA